MEVQFWRHRKRVFTVCFFVFFIQPATMDPGAQNTEEMATGSAASDVTTAPLASAADGDYANLSAVDAQWQPVAGTTAPWRVYSAHLDAAARSVRIIGEGTMSRPAQTLWCRHWFTESQHVEAVAAHLEMLLEHQGLEFGAYFITCRLAGSSVPASVSVVWSLLHAPTNRLRVMRAADYAHAQFALSVCVRPLQGFDKAAELVEFVEMYRLLGAEHFTMYLTSADPAVVSVLRHYQRTGILELLPWQLGLRDDQVNVNGQLAAMNDCLLRHRARSKNLAMVDLDEFIVPRANLSLLQLIRNLDGKWTNEFVGSYVFQNAFFYQKYPRDLSTVQADDTVAGRLLSVTLTRRQTVLLPHEQRSKFVCKPAHVRQVCIHSVCDHAPGYKGVFVAPTAALSHHYRECVWSDECLQKASVVDRTARRYRSQLVEAVRAAWRDLAAGSRPADLPPAPS